MVLLFARLTEICGVLTPLGRSHYWVQIYYTKLEPTLSKVINPCRAERVVALYFNVRIRVRGDAPRTRSTRQQNKNFLTTSIQAERGPGRAAKKMKGSFCFASLLVLQKVSFQAPFKLRTFHYTFLHTGIDQGATCIQSA